METEMKDMNEDIEMGAFQIIAAVGTARSCYIEAIHAAKAHDYSQAESLIAKGDESFAQGHDAHLEMLGKEAEGNKVACLLIIHAEDQLMSAEGFKLIALELIDVYKEMENLSRQGVRE